MNKYTSHEIQNSILKVMATYILRDIYESIKLSPFITVMMDEATDISNKEQVTIVFIGLFEVPSIDSKTLATVLKDSLCRMNIPMERIRGQCYDGASTMKGARGGVAKIIMDEEPRALYTLLWTLHQSGHE